MLTRVTGRTALFFAVVTLVLAAWAVAGGPAGNIRLGIALTVFFAGYWFLSSRREGTGRT